jgi:hypothetical protein
MKPIKSVELATDEQLRQLAMRMALPNELWMICQSKLPLLSIERTKLRNFLTINHVVGFV